jgi:polyisoprenyl-teichoic acid--peptidoglycan teichoic acid transferase
VTEKIPHNFSFFKIRTLQDQRFLITWTIVSFIVSLLVSAGFAAKYVLGEITRVWPQSSSPFDNSNPLKNWTPPWQVFRNDKLTFILLGYDAVDEFAHRSDTLMVGSIDFYAKEVKVLSIPRDTLIHVPGYSFMKVNAAYALGEDDLVRRTVEEFTGIQVDYVVTVNYQGFVDVVNALGGVDINVDRSMNYDDRRGDVHIHIEPGEHHFDGQTALEYARFRHDARGDLGRIERQQNLIRALFDQKLNLEHLSSIDNIAGAVLNSVGISVNNESPRHPPDIGIREIASLVGFLSLLNDDEIQFYQVPTTDLFYEGLSCLRPLYSETNEVLSVVFADNDQIAWQTLEGTPLSVVPLEPEVNISLNGPDLDVGVGPAGD